MLMRRTFLRGLHRLSFWFSVFGLSRSMTMPSRGSLTPRTPSSGMLKGEVAPQRVAVLARQRGIDFQITSVVESELRRAGATADLLATLREVAPNED